MRRRLVEARLTYAGTPFWLGDTTILGQLPHRRPPALWSGLQQGSGRVWEANSGSEMAGWQVRGLHGAVRWQADSSSSWHTRHGGRTYHGGTPGMEVAPVDNHVPGNRYQTTCSIAEQRSLRSSNSLVCAMLAAFMFRLLSGWRPHAMGWAMSTTYSGLGVSTSLDPLSSPPPGGGEGRGLDRSHPCVGGS